ncbi:MAG: hypothetical protein FWE61_03700 [Micrococcales bacterium]|nr:hypothetical protein [Micrococcales bacterium]
MLSSPDPPVLRRLRLTWWARCSRVIAAQRASNPPAAPTIPPPPGHGPASARVMLA